jgi:hypothetical protein
VIVTDAILCGYAEIREGLITIVSGGITEVRRASFPGPLNTMLALMLSIDDADLDVEQGMFVSLRPATGDGPVQRLEGTFTIGRATRSVELRDGSPSPLVIDLRLMPVISAGPYVIDLIVNGIEARTFPITAIDTTKRRRRAPAAR